MPEMRSNRNFDYELFDDYGCVFDASKYTPEQAINIYKEEYGYKDVLDIDFEVYEIKLRYFPRMSKEEMWYYDIYDNKDNRGIYRVVEDEDIHIDPENKGFKCWRIRYDKAHREVRDEYNI